MPYYAAPNITSVTDMFTYMNAITSASFGIAFILGIWGIMFLGLKTAFRTEVAFTYASFSTAVLAVMFNIVGMVPLWFVLIPIIMLLIGIYLLKSPGE